MYPVRRWRSLPTDRLGIALGHVTPAGIQQQHLHLFALLLLAPLLSNLVSAVVFRTPLFHGCPVRWASVVTRRTWRAFHCCYATNTLGSVFEGMFSSDLLRLC